MNNNTLTNLLWHAKYVQKPHTTSYIHEDFFDLCYLKGNEKRDKTSQRISEVEAKGAKMLMPICLTLADDDQLSTARIARTGRGMKKRERQMKSSFTIPEASPYKIAKPYRVCSSVWRITGRSSLFYGDIAVNHRENDAPKTTHDLLVIKTDDWIVVEVMIFKGLAKPNDEANLDEVVTFIDTCM